MRITVEVTEHTDTPIRVEGAENLTMDDSWADEYGQLLLLAARTAREAQAVRAQVRNGPSRKRGLFG